MGAGEFPHAQGAAQGAGRRSPTKSAEITFFHFGPDSGGDIQSNAQRWVSQFRGNENAAKIETQEIGGAKVTLVSTEGTYSSGMPGGPRPRWTITRSSARSSSIPRAMSS